MTGTDPIIFPDGFTIPKKIRKVGTNFCNKMFYGIGEFTSTNNELILPDSFELPEELDEVGSNFCARMFYGINFDVPPINLKVPKLSNSFVFDASTNCFCDQFFRESKIKKLNKNFTFNNPNLVDYGNAFNEFFRLCTLLEYGNNEEGTMLSFTDNTTLPFKDWFFQGDTFIVNGVNDESILESVTGK
jgi:hypothetical protein